MFDCYIKLQQPSEELKRANKTKVGATRLKTAYSKLFPLPNFGKYV